MIKKVILTLALMGAAMSVQAKDYLIDVRTPAELAETGRVQGALNDDFRSPDFIEKFKALNIDPNDTVNLYCRTGIRAGKAKTMLEQLGYKHVNNLGGYEDAAKKLNLPLVK